VIQEHKESAQFAELFGGIIVIHSPSRFDKEKDSNPRLYHVQRTSEFSIHIVQVPLILPSLNSKDVFIIIDSNNEVAVWRGSHSPSFDFAHIVKLVVNVEDSSKIAYLEESKEPASVWTNFSHNEEDPSNGYPLTNAEFGKKYTKIPSLYKLTFLEGKFQVSQVPYPIYANDFESTSVYVLDTGHELYIWTGTQLYGGVEDQSKLWVQGYKEFVQSQPNPNELIEKNVKPFAEPPEFTRHFQAWFRSEPKKIQT